MVRETELTIQPEDLESVLGSWPKIDLLPSPTIIHCLPRLSDLLDVPIYCKRDDLTTVGFGGNKIRKLEYLIQDALDHGADSIVTCGSIQSNWCRMTAVAGSIVGLPVYLVLGGEQPGELSGNALLNEIVDAEMQFVSSNDDRILENAASELTASLAKEGRNPYRIVMGGSNGLGALGYVDAFSEILEFEEEQRLNFSTIIVATGSGGTQAGLIAGQSLSKWQGEIVGMAVSRNKRTQSDKVRRVLHQFDTLTGTNLSNSTIVTNDSYVGDGYRKNTAASEEAIKMFAQYEGLFLDHVYTGKAAAGLIDYARKKRFDSANKVLFIHTGGAVQLFE